VHYSSGVWRSCAPLSTVEMVVRDGRGTSGSAFAAAIIGGSNIAAGGRVVSALMRSSQPQEGGRLLMPLDQLPEPAQYAEICTIRPTGGQHCYAEWLGQLTGFVSNTYADWDWAVHEWLKASVTFTLPTRSTSKEIVTMPLKEAMFIIGGWNSTHMPEAPLEMWPVNMLVSLVAIHYGVTVTLIEEIGARSGPDDAGVCAREESSRRAYALGHPRYLDKMIAVARVRAITAHQIPASVHLVTFRPPRVGYERVLLGGGTLVHTLNGHLSPVEVRKGAVLTHRSGPAQEPPRAGFGEWTQLVIPSIINLSRPLPVHYPATFKSHRSGANNQARTNAQSGSWAVPLPDADEVAQVWLGPERDARLSETGVTCRIPALHKGCVGFRGFRECRLCGAIEAYARHAPVLLMAQVWSDTYGFDTAPDKAARDRDSTLPAQRRVGAVIWPWDGPPGPPHSSVLIHQFRDRRYIKEQAILSIDRAGRMVCAIGPGSSLAVRNRGRPMTRSSSYSGRSRHDPGAGQDAKRGRQRARRTRSASPGSYDEG